MNVLETLKKEWYILVILLLPYALIPFIWDAVPDRVPVHWNIEGRVDNYAHKSVVLYWYPLIAISAYLLILVVPVIDPKQRMTIDQKPLPALRLLLPLFLTGLYATMIMPAFKPGWNQNFMILLLVTLLLLVLGNYMRTLRPNYFIGIRTPWTLEDPEIWRKTHQLGSKLWIGGPLLLLIAAFFIPVEVYSRAFFVVVVAMALVPLVYSFLLFRRNKERESK